MSRLDPLRERQDYLNAMEAQRELREPVQPPEDVRLSLPSPQRSRGEAPTHVLRPDVPFVGYPTVFYDRDRGYRLRESEVRTLADLGKFRIVGAEDVAIHVYAGRFEEMQKDLRSLQRQGLVRQGTFLGPEENPRVLLTLTKRGHRLLRANRIVPKDQALYHGFVKLREANHDADLYKLYQKHLVQIIKEGGHNPRVILDYELKRKINRDIARLGREARPEIARTHGLRVVRGRIPVPDLRIEYERPDGAEARVDLELVTEHYRGRSLADKVKAGFSLYTPRGESFRLRRVLDGQELTAEILSL